MDLAHLKKDLNWRPLCSRRGNKLSQVTLAFINIFIIFFNEIAKLKFKS